MTLGDGPAQAAENEVVGSLERDGYVVFDPRIDASVIDGAVAEIEEQFQPEGSVARALRRVKRAVRGRHTAVSLRDGRRVQDAWTISSEVRDIALAPAVLGLLEQAYGRRPRPFQTLNFRIGSEQRAHSDAMHFNSEPSGFMCGVWVALEDIGPDQGPLVYYPGSHKLTELTMSDVYADPTSRRRSRWRRTSRRSPSNPRAASRPPRVRCG